MQWKLERRFIDLAAALLSGLAVACLLTNLGHGSLISPRDPILALSTRTLFWLLGAGSLAVVAVCIWGGNPRLKLALVSWFALNLVVYEIGLYWMGARGARGYLGTLADTFGLSASTADILLKFLFLFLVSGGVGLLALTWFRKSPIQENASDVNSSDGSEFLKMTCVLCHGHIRFSAANLEQKIPCPHCRATITLKRQSNIKTSCSACAGHIEFPIDALGQTIACPHCAVAITLTRNPINQSKDTSC